MISKPEGHTTLPWPRNTFLASSTIFTSPPSPLAAVSTSYRKDDVLLTRRHILLALHFMGEQPLQRHDRFIELPEMLHLQPKSVLRRPEFLLLLIPQNWKYLPLYNLQGAIFRLFRGQRIFCLHRWVGLFRFSMLVTHRHYIFVLA